LLLLLLLTVSPLSSSLRRRRTHDSTHRREELWLPSSHGRLLRSDDGSNGEGLGGSDGVCGGGRRRERDVG